MKNEKVNELIDLFNILTEKGLDAFEIINGVMDELHTEKNTPIKV